MEAIKEMFQFLTLKSRPDLKSVALDSILGLTATADGLQALTESESEIFNMLAEIALKDPSVPLRKDAALALINLSADVDTAKKMTKPSKSNQQMVLTLWQMIENQVYPSADPACMTLSNLSIDKASCTQIWQYLQEHDITVEKVLDVLCVKKTMDKGEEKEKKLPTLHYLGPFLSNLTQLPEVRQVLLKDLLLERLLSFTDFKESSVRRGGIIGALRNCCFDYEKHDLLLNQLDLLPKLLLPLAGPTPDIFEEEEIEKLPIDLQYLDEDKEVEEDADIRKLLLEALLQLCATRKGREILREQNTYLILRELHKMEKDENVQLACENVVDILIKKEEEINFDNYKHVSVPEHITKDE